MAATHTVTSVPIRNNYSHREKSLSAPLMYEQGEEFLENVLWEPTVSSTEDGKLTGWRINCLKKAFLHFKK